MALGHIYLPVSSYLFVFRYDSTALGFLTPLGEDAGEVSVDSDTTDGSGVNSSLVLCTSGEVGAVEEVLSL